MVILSAIGQTVADSGLHASPPHFLLRVQLGMSAVPRNSLLLAATAIIFITTLRIEFLNAAAGHLLPRTELHGDGTLTKWRLPATSVTPQQSAEIRLRAVVASWGLIQYPLSIATLAFAVVGIFNPARRHRPAYAFAADLVAGLIAAACFVIACMRGYGSSLGW